MSRRRIGLFLLAVLASIPTLPGQCAFSWDPVFGTPGLSGSLVPGGSLLSSFGVWNDGSGAALHACGNFTAIGGAAANGIARWNGNSWTALGSGVSGGIIRRIVAWDDGNGDALFAAGSFPVAGGSVANGIARWDGQTWTSVGGGMNGAVADIVVHDDGTGPQLYAGGWFTQAGGLPANHVARWNGGTWSVVGAGLGNPSTVGEFNVVRTLGVFDDGTGPALYAGGQNQGGIFARWDGSVWAPIPVPTAFLPGCMLVHDDGSGPALFVGAWSAYLTSPVRRWNGSVWSSAGAFSSGSVFDMQVADLGGGPRLHIAGTIAGIPGSPPGGVLSWDGIAWTSFAATLYSPLALAAFDDGLGPALYVGGYLTSVNGVPANQIARWRSPRPVVEMEQPAGPSTGIVVTNRGLVPGRSYYNVFSTSVCPGSLGSGPYLGLCSPSLQPLLDQLALPLETFPFHFTAWSWGPSFGPYALPVGITVDAVCFDATGNVLGCVSPVARHQIQ